MESDSKKEAMLEELKVATKGQKAKLEEEKAFLAKDKEAFEA